MNSPLFLSLPQLSLNAALLIIVLAALRWLSRGRLPAQTRRLLWWLALLRLLLPLRLPCPISVWNWLPNLTAGDKHHQNSGRFFAAINARNYDRTFGQPGFAG